MYNQIHSLAFSNSLRYFGGILLAYEYIVMPSSTDLFVVSKMFLMYVVLFLYCDGYIAIGCIAKSFLMTLHEYWLHWEMLYT